MKRTARALPNLFVALLLWSCCLPQTGLAKRKPPKWVTERPATGEYYTGISVVKKDAAANYAQLAKNQALQDLCSEISITISSNSVLNQFENNVEFKEEFESNVKTSLVQDLEGYELVDSWDNKRGNEYWVYYRLSKEQYALQKRVKLNKAKKLSQTFFEEGKQLEGQLDLFQALNYYAKAIEAIKDYLDEDLSVMAFDGKKNLGVEIYNSIQHIFNSTQIVPEKKNIAIAISTTQKDSLLIKTVWQDDAGERAIPNLPLELSFSKGEGVVTNNIRTDQFGYATPQLSKVSSFEKLQEIEIGLDLADILDKSNENYELNKLFFNLEMLPKTKVFLNVERLKAFLNFDEKVFGEQSQREILKHNFKKELSENFFSFTNDKDQAKVILDIQTNVIKGEIKEGQNYKVYIVYLDCFFSLTDASSGLEIFNDAIYGIKGMKPIGYDYAVKEAYEQAVEEIHKTIIPKLNQLNL